MGNRGLHGGGGKGLETPERRTGSGHRLRSSPLKVSGKTLQYESFVCGGGGYSLFDDCNLVPLFLVLVHGSLKILRTGWGRGGQCSFTPFKESLLNPEDDPDSGLC